MLFIENRKQIGLSFHSLMAIFDFCHFHWVNCGQSWTKNSNFGCVLSMYKFEFLKILQMAFLKLCRLPVVKISAQSDVLYWRYCLQSPQNGPNWVLNQKKRSNFFQVKSTTANTQKLKLGIYRNGCVIGYVRIYDDL